MASIALRSFDLPVTAQSNPAEPMPVTSKAVSTGRLITGWEFRRGSLGGIWEVWRRANNDANRWLPVDVPHCFNSLDAVDPDNSYYQGPAWYRTRLLLKNPYAAGRTLLHFEGAGQKSEAYVYTERIGTHVGGYDEFTFDITAASKRYLESTTDVTTVPIAVMCDNSRDLEMIPSNLSDFNLYGGLYRYVNLLYVPAISLERVTIQSTLTSEGTATVAVNARLYNPDNLKHDLQIDLQVAAPDGRVVNSLSLSLPTWTGTRTLSEFTIGKPSLWSTDNPWLYRCSLTLRSEHGQMSLAERFGIRSFEFVKHGPFKLNGQRLLIRGTQRHEDHAGLGAAMTEELMRREMQLMKDMGVNFVRLGHHQQSSIVLDLCDELGLLVWEEIPWCRGGLGGERYKDQARRMLRNMIDQHRNHPSVIIWGLGNENDWPGDFEEFDKNKIRAFMSELNQLSHEVDPTRKTAIRRCDFCKDVVDVYSPSIWAGWYRGRYTEYKKLSQDEMQKVNHFLHMEWGGDSHAGRHAEAPDQLLAKLVAGQPPDERGMDYFLTGGVSRASNDGDWSETYICNLFDWHLKEQETMHWLTGAAQWIFKDFSTPSRPNNPVPRVNQKGLVERDLTLKEGYFVFQSYWSHKLMARIYGHSWSTRWGRPEEEKLVKVYSNCPRAELFVNGKSAGMKQRDSQSFPAAGLRWLVKFKAGENHLKVVATKDRQSVVDELTFNYQTTAWGKPARLVLESSSMNKSRLTVKAQLVDSNGVLCLDSRIPIRFALAGEGSLVDQMGTARASSKVELCNGCARIDLERTGPLVVSVSALGVQTAFLSLP